MLLAKEFSNIEDTARNIIHVYSISKSKKILRYGSLCSAPIVIVNNNMTKAMAALKTARIDKNNTARIDKNNKSMLATRNPEIVL